MYMRRFHKASIPILTGMLIVLTVGQSIAVESYSIDPVHSTILFNISHLGLSHFYGRFNDPNGMLIFDEAHPENSNIEVTVMVKAIDTANEKRDTHLKSKAFFNMDAHPSIRFQSRKVTKLSNQAYRVEGELTFLGITKTISFESRYLGSGKDPWGGSRIAFEATFSIKRSDYGMDFMNGPLGDDIHLIVNLEGIRQ